MGDLVGQECFRSQKPYLDFLKEGVIRVAHSYGGPLKEDKRGEGKVKWVPAPADAEQVLTLHLKRRRLKGAKAEDLVFPFVPAKPQNRRRTSEWTGYRKEYLEQCWEEATRGKGRPVKDVGRARPGPHPRGEGEGR
jgi:hypothetical protein